MDRRTTITCTLLVPEGLLNRLPGGDFHISLEPMVRYLLLRSGPRAQVRASGEQVTRRYQAPGSKLKRFNFRIEPHLWHQLDCYARVQGVSRCRAFCELLERYLNEPPDAGTPSVPRYRRRFILYYDIVRLDFAGKTTIIRSRKYFDPPRTGSVPFWKLYNF